jgi:hypothetical protein
MRISTMPHHKDEPAGDLYPELEVFSELIPRTQHAVPCFDLLTLVVCIFAIAVVSRGVTKYVARQRSRVTTKPVT